MSETQYIKTGCHLCWQQCGVILHVEDGVLKKCTPDPDHVGSGGYGCERLSAVSEFHYSEMRLNYPLKRKGERGEAKWERITWEQALTEIAEKLVAIRDEFGPEAVGKVGGTIHGPADWSSWRFFCHWGSPNFMNSGKNCGQLNTTVECAMYGWDGSGSAPELGVTKNIIMWGANPPESNQLKWNLVRACMDQGTKLVVIDPRLSEIAAAADLWLQIRPGTDGALGWGVINVLIEEGIYDKEFVEEWCSGFDQVAEKAKNYPPERVAEITEVPAEKIIELAHYCADGPTNFNWNLTCNHEGNGAGYAAAYTQAVIRSITGNMDRPGGNAIPGPISDDIDWYGAIGWELLFEHLENSDRDCVSAEHFPVCSKKMIRQFNEPIKKAWGGKGYGAAGYFFYPNTRGLVDAMRYGTPYPIKAFFIQCGNPLLTYTGAKNWHEALKKVDLLVGMDFFMTPSMALCDYVLPAASWIERPHMQLYWGLSTFNPCYKQPLPALHERKDDYYLWSELARRTGTQGEWPETLEGMYDLMLRPSGRTHGEIAESTPNYLLADQDYYHHKVNRYGFGTPSGKCELAPTTLAFAGEDPVPDYIEPSWSKYRTPDLAKEYPLVLTSGARKRPYWHTSYRELKTLRWQHQYPLLTINPEDARSLGIVDGEMVYIETPLGRVRQKARIDNGMKLGTVHAEAYWYFPEMPEEEPYLFGVWDTNINSILPDDYECSDIAGNLPFRGMLCKVYPCDTDLAYDQVVAPEVEG